MALTPDTEIRLLKLPLTIDNKNQLTFNNLQAQTNYFLSIEDYIDIDECSYQRKDNIIRFPAHIDTIIQYDYVMYKNKNYDDKWFYAFIIGMEYDNEGMTNVAIQTDVFQTWQFDILWKQSFIEREMLAVSDDIPRRKFTSRRS